MNELIRIQGLHSRMNSVEILKGIDLSVNSGESLALVGPNGAGKTTLLRHLNGLLKPSAGTVIVDGMDTRRAGASRFARLVGFLFQNPDHQIIAGSVRAEIEFGLVHTGIARDEHRDRVASASASLGLSKYLDADPFSLSRALRQRVALASVLALSPKVLVLDEPTSSQDERGAELIMKVAESLNASGTTIILVSHDMELIARFSKRVIVLVEGEVEADREVHATFRDERLLMKAGLSTLGAYRMASALGIAFEKSQPLTAATLAGRLGSMLAGANT